MPATISYDLENKHKLPTVGGGRGGHSKTSSRGKSLSNEDFSSPSKKNKFHNNAYDDVPLPSYSK